MNEFFAIAPTCCSSLLELKLLLRNFGPFAGRYLATYPDDWSNRIEAAFKFSGDVEQERLKTLLRRAREELVFLGRSGLAWKDSESWMENASKHLNHPPVFQGVIVEECNDKTSNFYEPGDDRISLTADERVIALPEEYVRVCRFLLLLSPELHLIDPYLSPLKNSVADVLGPLFEVIGRGKCKSITIWARHSEMIRDLSHDETVKAIRGALVRLATKFRLKSGTNIAFKFIQDETRTSKMHGRYLLSIKGGVRLEHGFQMLPRGRKADISPVGKASFDSLISTYHENENDFGLVESTQFMVA